MNRRALLLGGLGTLAAPALSRTRRQPPGARRSILVWSEGTAPKEVYPDDIRGAVAAALEKLPGNYQVRTATLSDPGQGVDQKALDDADVLFWWGHQRHGDITDEAVQRIATRVRDGGMGFVALHSSHFAKPFQSLMGSSGAWREYVNDGQPEKVRVIDRRHPVGRGLRDFTLPREERYGEPFQVPKPDAAILEATYAANGETARQLLCWSVGAGRVAYFRPGHEEYPVYFQPEVRRALRNMALWCARDEAGIWEDNDPFARAARDTKEPPLSLILRGQGFGGTDVTDGGEIPAQRLVRAGAGPVRVTVLAAFGVEKPCFGGWYQGSRRSNLFRLDGANNKKVRPTLTRGSKIAFNPGDAAFGLWVGSQAFPGEVVYTEDERQRAISRFGENRHKAHAWTAVRSDGSQVANAVIYGFEYSTNDDCQEVVLLVENVRPA